MKKRARGFIGEDHIDHNGEPFDYIQELHAYLWRVVQVVIPDACGSIGDFIDPAIEKLEEVSQAMRR